MVPYFPLVGILLGLMVALFDAAVAKFWAAPIVALLDVILLAVLSAAFHLDGLADTADGLLSSRPRDEALEIMKDSRIGTMGLVVVLFGLSVKWGGIAGLNTQRMIVLVAVPAYARSAILFGMRYLPYGRTDGTGKPFFDQKLALKHFWGLALPVGASLLLGLKAVWLILSFVMIVCLILWFYKRRLGSITGDMLGAMVEITEAGLFLLMSLGTAL
jgi:adenosylcobinamide-GDP ribazoletransferase